MQVAVMESAVVVGEVETAVVVGELLLLLQHVTVHCPTDLRRHTSYKKQVMIV